MEEYVHSIFSSESVKLRHESPTLFFVVENHIFAEAGLEQTMKLAYIFGDS
jgi:hypothetical protein